MLKRWLTAEAIVARRQARRARWDRPIGTRLARARAWANMLLVDHGVVRMIYPNRVRVSPELWRSSQPDPRHIAWFAAQGGRTVVNLRGGRDFGSWPLEREACERHGLKLVEFTLRSREAPGRDALLATEAFLDGLEYPILVHCKSGADRAGLFAALFLIVRTGAGAGEARRQLSLRFGHIRQAKTGILDFFLDAFEREGERRGLSFAEWVRDVYDPVALQQDFTSRPLGSLLVDRIMRRE